MTLEEMKNQYPEIPIGTSTDYTNQKFGKLTCLYRTNSNSSGSVWVCQCECGNIKPMAVSKLKKRKEPTCGCGLSLDITGKRFGKLVAISKAPSKNGKTYWLCQCDCGNQKEIQTNHLTSGATQSCGCLNDSINHKGQAVIDLRRRVKIALVEAFGHKCAYCGLEDNPVLYDFHHLNPEEKEFGVGSASTTRSREAYLREAKKCVLLCSNCHRRIENGLITNNDLHYIEPNEKIYWETLEKLKTVYK